MMIIRVMVIEVLVVVVVMNRDFKIQRRDGHENIA